MEIRGLEKEDIQLLREGQHIIDNDAFLQKLYSKDLFDMSRNPNISKELDFVVRESRRRIKGSSMAYEVCLHGIKSRSLEQIRGYYGYPEFEELEDDNIAKIELALPLPKIDEDENVFLKKAFRDNFSILYKTPKGEYRIGTLKIDQDVKDLASSLNVKYNIQAKIVQITLTEMVTILTLDYGTTVPDEVERRLKRLSEAKLMHYIIEGIDRKATDVIFTSVGREEMVVSFLIYNCRVVYDVLELTEAERQSVFSSFGPLVGDVGSSFTLIGVQDKRINHIADTDKYYGRVNITTDEDKKTEVVIRILEKDKKAIPLKELNIQDQHKDLYRKAIKARSGIFLLSGSTGDGKTTTIYSILSELRRTRELDRIVTVEEPVEQVLGGITQIAIGSDLKFEDVSATLTRNNPRVIFLGEVNKFEPAEFCIKSALQSLFVLSTIHSSCVSDIPYRYKLLLDSNLSLYEQFLNNIRGMSHQTMAKHACPVCNDIVKSEGYSNDDSMRTLLKRWKVGEFYTTTSRTPKCKVCNGMGFIINDPVIITETCILNKAQRETMTGIALGISKERPNDTVKTFLEDVMGNAKTTKADSATHALSDKLINIQEFERILEIGLE